MDIILVAPDDTAPGGYNARMTAALRRAGHAVAERAKAPASPDGCVVFDSLILSVSDAPVSMLSRWTALVHHPAAASPELADTERDHIRALHRSTLPLFGRVVTSGAAVADRLVAEFGVDRARVLNVPPGVDDATRATGSEAGCHIVALGTVTPRKGYDLLLQALARLTDLDWRLTIVGVARPAPYAQTVAEMAGQLGIAPRVTIAGALDGAAMETVWAGADLFALATRWEAHGTAVAQALRRGVPVVVTEGAVHGVDVPADAGAVCADGTGLSRALRRLILNGGLRRQFADAAWDAGQKLPTWDEQARAFVAAIS